MLFYRSPPGTQQLTPIVVMGTVVNSDSSSIGNEIEKALGRYRDIGLFESDKKEQKRMLEAAHMFVRSNKSTLDRTAFADALKNNSNYGKDSETLHLVQQIVCSNPPLRILLEQRQAALQTHAAAGSGLFDGSANDKRSLIQALAIPAHLPISAAAAVGVIVTPQQKVLA